VVFALAEAMSSVSSGGCVDTVSSAEGVRSHMPCHASSMGSPLLVSFNEDGHKGILCWWLCVALLSENTRGFCMVACVNTVKKSEVRSLKWPELTGLVVRTGGPR
jgi:hypothetical protein